MLFDRLLQCVIAFRVTKLTTMRRHRNNAHETPLEEVITHGTEPDTAGAGNESMSGPRQPEEVDVGTVRIDEVGPEL